MNRGQILALMIAAILIVYITMKPEDDKKHDHDDHAKDGHVDSP